MTAIAYTPEELALEVAAGDETAFERLARELRGLVEAIAREFYVDGTDHQDLVQVGLMAMHEAACDYKPHFPSFTAFAAMVIRRDLIGELKAARRVKRLAQVEAIRESAGRDEDQDEGVLERVRAIADPPTEEIYRRDLLEAVFRAIWQLSELEGRSVELSIAGYSYEDIAQELRVAEKAVDNALQRGQLKIRRILEAEGWEVASA